MRRAFVLWLCLLAAPLWALDPSEMLDDPALEARARALDHEIRCVKCRSEAIASSNAEWAVDARRSVRELIAAGATDAEVKAWFVERYKEYVLMDPPKSGSTWLLWLSGPIMLGLALLLGSGFVRGRAARQTAVAAQSGLSDAEKARLREILDN